MCGISGIASPSRPLSDQARRRAAALSRWLEHRGPDESGTCGDVHAELGSRRLAIVAPNNGAQPFFHGATGTLAVVNGEIFNHRELRARVDNSELRTASDCEVILHLYLKHGIDLVELLRGQYAFGLWDPLRRRLVLGRDPLGVCPLHYTLIDGQLWFASELKALLAVGVLPGEVDARGLAQLARLGTALAPRTMIRGVSALEPGEVLCFDRAGITHHHGRRVSAAASYPPHQDAEGALRDALRGAVADRLMSDVPIGVFLSGGVDSGAVAALAASLGRRLPAFTVRVPHRHLDEAGRAATVAERLGLEHTVLRVDEAAVAGAFTQVIYHAETPVLSTESAALLLLARAAREVGIKVVLTGEGADEAFAGYHCHRLAAAPAQVQRITSALDPMLSELQASVGMSREALRAETEDTRAALGWVPSQVHESMLYRSLIPLIFRDEVAAELLAAPVWEDVGRSHGDPFHGEPLERSLELGYRLMLPNYLLGPHGDRAVMASGVEARYPFLDDRVVGLAASFPPEAKLLGQRDKLILRRAVSEFLPAEVVHGDKQRFMTAFGTPFIGSAATADMKRLLCREVLDQSVLFDAHKVGRVVDTLERTVAHRGVEGSERHLRIMALGVAVTLVASTQLFCSIYCAGSVPAALSPGRTFD
jgi:asparagine synthase (glutamine-hydrolysing)